MSGIISAKDAELNQTYLTKGGREVTVKEIRKDRIYVMVHITKNKVPIPLDYPLITDLDAKPASQEDPIEEAAELDGLEIDSSETPKEDPPEKPKKEKGEKKRKPRPSSNVGDKGTVKGMIRSLLEAGEELSVNELAERTNAATTTIRLKLSELRRVDGLAIVRENKKYKLES